MIRATIGKKSQLECDSEFLRLYGLYYKNNSNENEQGTLILPEGITYMESPREDKTTKNGNVMRKRITDSKKIIFPSTLKEIGLASFANCCNLEAIKLNEGLVHIGNSAFKDCKKLEWLECPKTLIEIESTAFGWCDSLEKVFFNEGLEDIGVGAFMSNHSLRRISVPENEIKCRYDTFADDDNITLEIRGTDIPKEFLKLFTEYNFPKQKKLIMKLKGIELSDNGVQYGAYYIWGDNNSYYKVITELEAMAQKRKKEKGFARE